MAIGIANDPRYKGGNYDGAVDAIEKIKKGNHFDLEINHFVDCILNNKESSKLNMNDSIHQAATMEAIYKSIQTNQWVYV